MKHYYVYFRPSGLFTGRMSINAAIPDSEVQEGCAVFEADEFFDPYSHRLDMTQDPPAVVDYQPPKPADTDFQAFVWDAATRRWMSMPTLAARRADKWGEIKAERERREFGTFTWDGSEFDCDSKSQARLMGATQLAAAGGGGFSIDWTLADNSVRALSAADLEAVGGALARHVVELHVAARELRQKVDTAQSADELAAITWPD